MVVKGCHITLSGLRFHAYHGVLPQEQKTGGSFVVDLQVMGNLEKAVYSDELSDTLNYGTIYELVKEEMMQPSKLLEHVAGRIGQRIFDTFPQVEMMVVTVTKENPPMGADLKGVSVTLVLSRGQ